MHAVSFTLLLAASSPSASPQARALGVAPAPRAAVSSPAPSPQPAGPLPTPRDRAANLLGGVWQCETIAGSTGTHTYTENEDDGSIELQTELHTGFRTFRITEIYRFDDSRNSWTVETQGGAYSGSAPAWNGGKWIFDGFERLRGNRRPVRMVYFDLGDRAFRRDFQARQEGVWQTYSAETCLRPSR
jgi:hypothetical protein